MGTYHFIDIYPYENCNIPKNADCTLSDNLMKNYIPAHTFMRLDFEEDAFTLIEFDNDKLRELFLTNRIRLDHEIIEDDIVIITASTKDLRKFITKYAREEKVFQDSTRMERTIIDSDVVE
jgi:hypothetical protein